MENGNKNVCWSCRAPDHFLWECPLRQICPGCGKGFMTFMKAVHVPGSMGKLFYGCTVRECDYFRWAHVMKPKEQPQSEAKQEAQTNGESSINDSSSSEMEYLSRVFSTAAKISEDKDVEVSLAATFHKLKS